MTQRFAIYVILFVLSLKQKFNILVDECYAALKVRQVRNEKEENLFQSSDNEKNDKMFRLYEQVVLQKLYIIDNFQNLAKASLSHI